MLFPTHEGFIDLAVISAFWAALKDKQSLVPSLLTYTFHTLHARHEKKNGMFIFYLPLLYNWLIPCMFKPNVHISEMSNEDWARTLVSLSSKDIPWYRYKMNVEEIIFGYLMHEKPDDKELEDMVFNDMRTNDPILLHKIIRSWEKVHTKGTELAKKNGAVRVHYQQWLAKAKRDGQEWKCWWDVATKQKKEEQARRASQICPRTWKEKYDELNTNKELETYWKEQYDSLKSQSMGWLNERRHLNEILDEYERTIKLLQPSVVAYHMKMANLIEFYNGVDR
ncbi:hypothetical protein KIW84_063595 [Lathyrus oleraceus]|uniref:DUF7745 domain-containing protein n=1 Tax=Pisum sativum TaxID=3888 RepID=A0A9D4WAG8_PEA|nr:hypothetical protein KIW84_063595 [Pisum sativum]